MLEAVPGRIDPDAIRKEATAMAAERQRQAAGGGQGGGHGGKPGGDKVAVTVRLSRDTFELLQNVALGHEFSKVAAASRGGRIDPRDRNQSVAAIIEHLIERHRDSLEAEDRLKLERGGKAPGPGSGPGSGKGR